MVPADAPGVLLDGRQGGLKGYEGAMLNTAHDLPSMTIRVDCELLGGCFDDRTHYAAEQEISFYDSLIRWRGDHTQAYAQRLRHAIGRDSWQMRIFIQRPRCQKVVSGASFPAWLATLP
jgi:hypothetical protein